MDKLLETHGLVKQFGGFKAVSNVDLSVDAGEVRCIIGPNGAGKSTFLRLAVGFYEPTAGSIYFKNEDISSLPFYRRIVKGLGVKFQAPGVFPTLSAEENLLVALQRTTSSENLRAELDRLMDLIGLDSQRQDLAQNLSHGQQQWLDIGMAMGSHPELLLLDEPTAGMSPAETFRTGVLVQKLNAEGVTIIAIEHDMEFVRQIAHKVTVFHYGKVFREGSISSVEADRDVMRIYLGNA
ncbi:MAG: ABC transporter ATP-binding protein [Candidimonas sp.]|nr:MAG: ABC transporter ATP-binding protein [Candidimonas sp.]